MTVNLEQWERRAEALWDRYDEHIARAGKTGFVAAMDELATELGEDHPVALHERGGARDSTGDESGAVELYRRALAAGLDGGRRRQCVIQLASSLRNVGQAAEGARLLQAERDAGSDELDDAVAGFLALTLVDSGREREALSVALLALSRHLTRYRRSMENYARDLAP